jgi:hypothetical protein
MLKSVLIASAAVFASFGAQALTGDVAFDGYCDGMHFDSLGGGFIGGASTGCVTDPVHGVTARIKAQGKGNVVTAYGSSGGLTFIVRNDHTWYIETADGTGAFINSGTWTAGTPLAPNKGRAAGQK